MKPAARMKLEAWYASNIGLVRKSNQDEVGCFPDLRLFIVADGMGGRAEGEIASRMAVEIVHDSLTRLSSDSIPAADREPASGRGRLWRFLFGGGQAANAPQNSVPDLREAVELANQRIFEAGQNQSNESPERSMGTTVVALICALEQCQVHWAYVGDSRLYLVRDRNLTLLTADHTLFGEAYRDQRSVPSDLPHTNRLIRALGINPDVEVSTGSDELRVGDLFLLCSDGVSGMLKPSTILNELLTDTTLADAGNALIQLALDAGGKDNASALLVKVLEG